MGDISNRGRKRWASRLNSAYLDWSAVARGVSGAGSGFRVEWCTAGGIQFLFFGSFLLVLAELSFLGGGGLGAGLSFYGKHRKVSKYYETVDTKSQLTPTILIFFLDQICSNRVFPGENGNFACVHGRYFLFRTRADRHNSILMSLLLLVAETIKAIVGRYTDDTNLTIMLLQAYPYVCINIFLCLSRHIKFYPTPCLLIKCKTAFFYKILIACFFLITFQHIVAKRFWFGLSSK